MKPNATPSRRDFLRVAGVTGLGAVVAARGSSAWQLDDVVAVRARARGGRTPGAATTEFMDPLWDESLGLIASPFNELPPVVRETSWYALGLLARHGAGDVDRARHALETVVARQYNSPGTVFHGSFPRFSGDAALPPANATPFVEFDPNWRQFIGTALAIAALRYGDALGPARAAIERSVDLAAAGEPPDRIQPDYSNIAIMHAWLLAHTGARREGEALAVAIAERYRNAGALDEYNSPTYDGVSLYGLGLWREEPPSRRFASLGEELHAGVWRNIAGTYHAGLRNACGPFSRAYEMDMSSYAAQVGLWIWSVVGEAHAPFPDLTQHFDHAGDVCFGPLVDLFANDVPSPVRRALISFGKERTVHAGVPDTWQATSWLGKDVMLGGWTGVPVRVGGQQIHPATVHWDGGWIRVLGDGRIDATAHKGRLDITIAPPGPARVTIGVPGLAPTAIAADHWVLPGLTVEVRSGAPPSGAPTSVEEGVELVYPATTLRLDVAPT
jgi:hypothetical protein